MLLHLRKEGFHFDLGASLAEVMQPIEMAFKMLGTTFQDEVDLVSCDPIYSFIFRDSSRLSVPLSMEGAAEESERIAPDCILRTRDSAVFGATVPVP